MLIIKYKNGTARGVRADDFKLTEKSLFFSVVDEWWKDEGDVYKAEKWYSNTSDSEIPLYAVAEIIIDGTTIFSAEEVEEYDE